MTVCDLADAAEHGHPHHTFSNTAGRWSRSMHPNKKILAHEYVDVTSTVRPNANHWKPEPLYFVSRPYGRHETHFDWDRRCTLSTPSTRFVSRPIAIDKFLLGDLPAALNTKSNLAALRG